MLTHTEDVEAEALRDRLADQLIREAVKANMAPKGKVPLLFILEGRKQTGEQSCREAAGQKPNKELLPGALQSRCSEPSTATTPCAAVPHLKSSDSQQKNDRQTSVLTGNRLRQN